MMRSSLVGAAFSLLTLGSLTVLGLNVPTEPMARADPVGDNRGGDSDLDDRVDDGRLIGPVPVTFIGPVQQGVPDLPIFSAAPPVSAAQAGALPERLRVPALDVDAPIIGTGVDELGLFAVPNPRQVGWYEHGSAPGEEGAAVLAAHVDLGHVPGVFFHLDDVLIGDRIYVDFDDGSSVAFEVVDDVLYDKTALPESELFRRSGDSVLHLVTCGGVYDAAAHHYLGNRVVTARPLG